MPPEAGSVSTTVVFMKKCPHKDSCVRGGEGAAGMDVCPMLWFTSFCPRFFVIRAFFRFLAISRPHRPEAPPRSANIYFHVHASVCMCVCDCDPALVLVLPSILSLCSFLQSCWDSRGHSRLFTAASTFVILQLQPVWFVTTEPGFFAPLSCLEILLSLLNPSTKQRH